MDPPRERKRKALSTGGASLSPSAILPPPENDLKPKVLISLEDDDEQSPSQRRKKLPAPTGVTAPRIQATLASEHRNPARAAARSDLHLAGYTTSPPKFYTGPNTQLTPSQVNELEQVWQSTRSPSPLYVFNLRSGHAKSGLFLAREMSELLPNEEKPIQLLFSDGLTPVYGKVKKYRTGKCCITSGWGKLMSKHNLKSGLHALHFYKRNDVAYPMGVVVFKLH
ncbi:hypothetical protein ACP70R_009416 [Stipagrostis hirtigluma subsp. patula]